MIRIAHIADIHLSERVRFDGTVRVLEEFAEYVESTVGATYSIDLVLIAGDIADPRRAPARATPLERNTFARFVLRLAECCPVVCVRGNHDAPGDWTWLNWLRGGHMIRWKDEGPDCLDVIYEDGRHVIVHTLPWQSPRAWAEYGDLGVEEAMRVVFGATGEIVEDMPDAIHVGLGHLSAKGGKLPSGQELVGAEVEVPAHLLNASKVSYFALGHLHSHQQVPGTRAWYAGSPNRLNFGEAGKPCGFNDVIVHDDGSPEVTFVPLDADKLHTIDVTVTEDGGGYASLGALDAIEDGADIRLRVRVPEGVACEDVIVQFVGDIERSGATAHVERIVLSQLRAREGADDVAKAPSIDDKLDTYLRQRGVGDDQRERVLARFDRLKEAQA